MPSSKYVYAGANQRTGSVPNRRRSQRIRRNSIGKPSSSSNNFSDDERIDDPDETMLEEDKDETILLSDDEEIMFGSGEGKMDADEKFAKNDNPRSRSRSRSRSHHPASSSSSSSPAGIPMPIRGGASGFLSNDPLTSSTMATDAAATATTPSSEAQAQTKTNNNNNNKRVNTKERLRKFAERFDSDESDDDLSESEFLQAVARKQAQRQALLAESQYQSRTQQQQQHSDASFRQSESFLQTQQHQQYSNSSFCQNEPSLRYEQHQHSNHSFRHNESFLQTQQHQQSNHSLHQNESEETALMANHGTSSSHNQSLSESFAATQPWEKEMDIPMMKSTSDPQNAPQKDRRMQECQPGHQRKQPPSDSLPNFPRNDLRKDHRRQDHPPNENNQGKREPARGHSNHHSLPIHAQHAPQQDHRNHQYQPNHQGKRGSHETQQNHHTNQNAKQGSSNTQPNCRDICSVGNPYHRQQPPAAAKKSAANVPKITLEHLKSGKKSGRSKNNRPGSSHDNTSTSTNNVETWQAEAFRSSLLDLLRSFPSNYFDISGDEAMDDGSGLFATSATANIGDESPHSTTSQSAASAQLQRKRLFDAASRSLARLAIASRHSLTKNGNGGSRINGGSGHDEESPDFNPPSPRSLPSYMSVLNVYDDSSPNDCSWGGNANAMLSTSKEVFSGHSVHGRNARTVHLSGCVPDENENPSRTNFDEMPSSNPFFLWTLEQLAYGSMVLAAQVCHEASCDPNFDGKNSPSSSESESCRVAGFVQNSNQGNGKRPVVSSALVESSLGFLATAFACLESDFVYSVLKSTLKARSGIPNVIVFDALGHFAPVGGTDLSHDISTQPVSTISMLSLLALSRGFEAALYVARYATSLDPSSACAAYSSPHLSCIGGTSSCIVNTGVDEGGVGWHSALGRDLGLKLESNLNSRPRHMHLSEVAGYAYDFILGYNPMIVDDEISGRDERSNHRHGNSRKGLYIDTQSVSQSRSGDGVACRQPLMMKDRLYAACVEFLSSMIHAGIVSSWLSTVPAEGDLTESDCCARTVERLAPKLFFVIETRARLRRSTNQNTAKNDSGDSEAVCAASLSLLILALPKHVSQSTPSSLSTSFRTMGNSTGTIEDLIQSPLVGKMIEMALSWQDTSQRKKINKEIDTVAKLATSNAMYVLSDICMAGGSSLICSHFCQSLDGFLQSITESLCERGNAKSDENCVDNSSVGSSILFLLQLHTGLPMVTRKFLRTYFEQSSKSGTDCATSFVSGLLHLSANKSFSASSCASSLLRALVDGNPVDRTQDRLSEIILNSFDTDQVGSIIEALVISLVETTYSTVHCNVPNFGIRWQPYTCSLGDLLGVCIPSSNVMSTFSLCLSDEVLNLFANAIEPDRPNNLFVDTLSGSSNSSLLFLFASFANHVPKVSNKQSGVSILTQQRNVKEKLLISASSFLAVLEVAMTQGTSADMTHRALKLQNSLLSLSDERSLARTFTKASNSVSRKEATLRDKLAKSEIELKEMRSKYQNIEAERDELCNSFHDQRFTYERRLEWTRSEAQMTAKSVSQIHVDERKQAEERYSEEKELRIRTEQANEQLTRETTTDKSRIKELEELLSQERKSRQDLESALESCKNELSTTSGELERTSNAYADLQEIYSASEEKISHLTATNEDANANLEDTCAKLIKLATIYQSKESEMDKYKAELRSAVNTANRHADTAIQKYEYAKQKNQSLSKKFEEMSKELKDIKAHRAGVQRMRKNAPVAYLNQLHNDPRIKEKKQSRRNHAGKENVRR